MTVSNADLVIERARRQRDLAQAVRLSGIEPSPRLSSRSFLAVITGHAAITANAKYKYAWAEARLADDGVESMPGGRSGTTSSDYAVNLVELSNGSATTIGGDGVNPAGASYPTGFKRRPIGSAGTSDGHAVDVTVWMSEVFDSDDELRYVFSMVNAHDGTCS